MYIYTPNIVWACLQQLPGMCLYTTAGCRACMHEYIGPNMYMQVCRYRCVYMCVCARACVHARACTCIHTYRCVCVCVDVCICVYTVYVCRCVGASRCVLGCTYNLEKFKNTVPPIWRMLHPCIIKIGLCSMQCIYICECGCMCARIILAWVCGGAWMCAFLLWIMDGSGNDRWVINGEILLYIGCSVA